MPELHRKNAGELPDLFFMELTPRPEVHKKLKALAQREGVSLNALLVPFLNDIAAGRLVRVPHYPPQPGGQKVA